MRGNWSIYKERVRIRESMNKREREIDRLRV